METWGLLHDRYLEPPEIRECAQPDCEDGHIYGWDDQGRTVVERCISRAHMTDAEWAEYAQEMRAEARG